MALALSVAQPGGNVFAAQTSKTPPLGRIETRRVSRVIAGPADAAHSNGARSSLELPKPANGDGAVLATALSGPLTATPVSSIAAPQPRPPNGKGSAGAKHSGWVAQAAGRMLETAGSVQELPRNGDVQAFLARWADGSRVPSAHSATAVVSVEPADQEAIGRQIRALQRWRQSEQQGAPRTLIVASSISTDFDTGMVGEQYYDVRLLVQILAATDPRVQIFYLTALPIPRSMIDHVLRDRSTDERRDILSRVRFVTLNDGSVKTGQGERTFLTRKLLDPRYAPQLGEVAGYVQAHKAGPARRAPAPAILVSYLSTRHEFELAERLGIPDAVQGAHHSLSYLGGKSWGRKIAKLAGARIARGREDIYDFESLMEAIGSLRTEVPGLAKVAVKLNWGISGGGNAYIDISWWDRKSPRARVMAVQRALKRIKIGEKNFIDLIGTQGAALEEFLDLRNATFPSVQVDILPGGIVRPMATHEQLIKDGNVFLGARFPANAAYRKTIDEIGRRVAQQYAKRGVLGWLAMDFACIPIRAGFDVYYMEGNIRLSGTTHPNLAARLKTGAEYIESEGKLRAPNGGEVRYWSMDHDIRENLGHSKARPGLTVDAFQEFMENHDNGVILDDFDEANRTRTLVVFHLQPAITVKGNVGYTIIGVGNDATVTSEMIEAAIARKQTRLTRALDQLEVEHVTGASYGRLKLRSLGRDARETDIPGLTQQAREDAFRRWQETHRHILYNRHTGEGAIFHPHGHTVIAGSAARATVLENQLVAPLEHFVHDLARLR